MAVEVEKTLRLHNCVGTKCVGTRCLRNKFVRFVTFRSTLACINFIGCINSSEKRKKIVSPIYYYGKDDVRYKEIQGEVLLGIL